MGDTASLAEVFKEGQRFALPFCFHCSRLRRAKQRAGRGEGQGERGEEGYQPEGQAERQASLQLQLRESGSHTCSVPSPGMADDS